MEQRMERIEASVACVKRRGDEFQQMYGEALKEILESKAARAKLWATAQEELVKKGVWAALLFLGAVTLVSAKEYIKRLIL